MHLSNYIRHFIPEYLGDSKSADCRHCPIVLPVFTQCKTFSLSLAVD